MHPWVPDKVLVRLKLTSSFSVAEGYTAQVFTTVRLSTSGRSGALAPLSLLPRDLHPNGGGWRDLFPPVREKLASAYAASNVRPVHTTLGRPLPPSRRFTPPLIPNLRSRVRFSRRTDQTHGKLEVLGSILPKGAHLLSPPVSCSSAPTYGRSRQNF